MTAATIPTSTPPWKPTRDQVRAAAMAFARVDFRGWMKLPSSSREDFLIDGHAALVAAHQIDPRVVATYGTAKPGDLMVCMTKEHADAYAELVVATEEILKVNHPFSADLHMQRRQRIDNAMERLRALASPERTTP